MRNRHRFLLDLILVLPLPFGAMALQMESFAWAPEHEQAVFAYAGLALAIRLGVAHSAGLYRFLWRHASLVELERLVFTAVTAAALTMIVGGALLPGLGLAPVRVPLVALALDALMAAAVLAAPRLLVRYSARGPASARKSRRPTIIVGAGNLGHSILKELHQDEHQTGFEPVAIVDDDQSNHGHLLVGLPVVSSTATLSEVIATYHAVDV